MVDRKVIAEEGRLVGSLMSSKRIAGYVSQKGTSVIEIVLLQECFPTLKTPEVWVSTLDSLFSLVTKPMVRFDAETVIITMPVHQLTSHWVIEGLNEFMQHESTP